MNKTQFTDCYFTKTMEAAKHNPVCTYQVFQKKESVLAGMGYVLPLFDQINAKVEYLPDGTNLTPSEPVMKYTARIQDVSELETILLGILDETTRVATEVAKAVKAAKGKPVLFFPARFAAPEVQRYHGYAAAIGGAVGCSTWEQQEGFAKAKGLTSTPKPVGTMPHALIAANMGDTVAAAIQFAEARPNEDNWVLVDFHNDCSRTAVEVAKGLTSKGLKLAGVRLDTSEKLIDEGLIRAFHSECPRMNYESFKQDMYTNRTELRGVCTSLVELVRYELDKAGFPDVKIAVSGGFTPDKISLFEFKNTPVDVYAVGEGFLKGMNPFTSDIVNVNGTPCSKLGRKENLWSHNPLTYKEMQGSQSAAL